MTSTASTTGNPGHFGLLIADAKAGSTEVLGRILELCRGYLLRVASAELDVALLPKGGASDLVQESFLEAQRAFARFEGESDEELLRWLRGILIHKLREFRRHYRGTTKRQLGREIRLEGSGPEGDARGIGLADHAPSPSALIARDEDAEAVRSAMARLPEHYRQVLVWREWEEVEFAEIGRRLGRTPDAARMLFWRALERLEGELRLGVG